MIDLFDQALAQSSARVFAQTDQQDRSSLALPVVVAFGDGTGPEIMQARLKVLMAAGAKITVEPIEIGETAYCCGYR